MGEKQAKMALALLLLLFPALARARTLYLVMSSHRFLEERVSFQSGRLLAGRPMLTVVENIIPSRRHAFTNCTEAHGRSISGVGDVFECAGVGDVLVARGCFVDTHDQLGPACKANSILQAALRIDNGTFDWYVLMDDDVIWRAAALERGLSRLDPKELHAFGFYGCNYGAGVPKCVMDPAAPNMVSKPRCWPAFAVMSAATLRAIRTHVEENLMMRVSEVHKLWHDTGLGVAFWGVGARTNLGIVANGAGGEVGMCLNETTKADKDPTRPCVFMHQSGVSGAKMRVNFQSAALDPPGLANFTIPDAPCGGSGNESDYLKLQNKSLHGDAAARQFLEECVLLA